MMVACMRGFIYGDFECKYNASCSRVYAIYIDNIYFSREKAARCIHILHLLNLIRMAVILSVPMPVSVSLANI